MVIEGGVWGSIYMHAEEAALSLQTNKRKRKTFFYFPADKSTHQNEEEYRSKSLSIITVRPLGKYSFVSPKGPTEKLFIQISKLLLYTSLQSPPILTMEMVAASPVI